MKKASASASQCIESHSWNKKKVNFESSIFFHENSCKCMQMDWISHLTKKTMNFESMERQSDNEISALKLSAQYK